MGVLVKVGVGVMGVEVGIAVGAFVEVGTGVGAESGVNTEQEKVRTAQTRWMCIFFMAFLALEAGILSRVHSTCTAKDQ